MGDIVDQSAVGHLFELFVFATAMIIFWFIESVWRLDRKWMIPIIIFPPSIFYFIITHWEESRAKCFFSSLLIFVMLMVGGVVGESFIMQMIALFQLIAFWPYYLYAYFSPQF